MNKMGALTNKQHILLFIQEYGQGGAEKVAYMLADMLAATGRFEPLLCSLYAPMVPDSGSKVKRVTLGLSGAKNPLQKLGNYYKALTGLRRLKKEHSIDLTISSLWPCDWLSVLAGKEGKIAIIQINILNNPQNTAMVKAKRLVRHIYNSCDKVVLGGGNLWTEVTGFFGVDERKLQIIQNPIDSSVIERNLVAPLDERLQGLFEKYKVLVSANRLHHIKNTEALIRIHDLLPKDSGFRFLMIGEGEEKAAMEAQIRKHGLTFANLEDEPFNENADIFFLKFQKNIHNIITRAAAFVFPTMGEGLPLALIESMYCRVPVICSDCPNGGIFEIMQGAGAYDIDKPRTAPERTAGGWLMPVPLTPERDAIWRDTILELGKLDAASVEDLKSANRRRAMDFDMSTTSQKWIQLIDSII